LRRSSEKNIESFNQITQSINHYLDYYSLVKIHGRNYIVNNKYIEILKINYVSSQLE